MICKHCFGFEKLRIKYKSFNKVMDCKVCINEPLLEKMLWRASIRTIRENELDFIYGTDRHKKKPKPIGILRDIK